MRWRCYSQWASKDCVSNNNFKVKDLQDYGSNNFRVKDGSKTMILKFYSQGKFQDCEATILKSRTAPRLWFYNFKVKENSKTMKRQFYSQWVSKDCISNNFKVKDNSKTMKRQVYSQWVSKDCDKGIDFPVIVLNKDKSLKDLIFFIQ